MERIYDQAKDVHVRGTYVYGKASDTAAYVDSACTVKYKTSELKEVFIKGAVINIAGTLYTPLSFSVTSDVGSVTYAKPNSTTATSADLGTLSAVED